MARSVNAVASRAKRKKIIKAAKGYWGRRKNVWTVAKGAVEKGLTYAYRDRRVKKREFRKLWILRINAGAREHGMSYSQFMGALKNANIDLNRKVLADLAMNHPEAFPLNKDRADSSKVHLVTDSLNRCFQTNYEKIQTRSDSRKHFQKFVASCCADFSQ